MRILNSFMTKAGYSNFGTKYLVDETGILYEDEGNILMPASREPMACVNSHAVDIELLPGHRIVSDAPFRCRQCGNDRLQCFISGYYETSAKCPDCGIQEVIHRG